MNAKEKIVRSPTAEKILSRFVSPVYDNSRIGCTNFEVMGREIDNLDLYARDVYEQGLVSRATWSLPIWCYEYGVDIVEGMTYQEIRDLINRRRFLVLPPTEYNLESYASLVSGTEVEIEQNTGPHTFDVHIIRDPNDSTPYSWNEVYQAIKRTRPAHLSFNLIPAISTGVTVEVRQYIYKFHNPRTGQKGLRAGTYPGINQFGRIIRENISFESAGETYEMVYDKAGTKPGITKYAELYFANVGASSDSNSYPFYNPKAGTVPSVQNLGASLGSDITIESDRSEQGFDIKEAGERPSGAYQSFQNLSVVNIDDVGVDIGNGVYDYDLIEAGIRPLFEEEGSEGLSAEADVESFGIVNQYCGFDDFGGDI